jgi:hypothetical protein
VNFQGFLGGVTEGQNQMFKALNSRTLERICLLAPFDNPMDSIDSDPAPEFSKTPELDHTLIREIFERFKNPPVYELYDVVSDPDCLEDLMGIQEHEAICFHLRTELEGWMRLTNDPLLPAQGLETWTRLHRENNSARWEDSSLLDPNR